MNTGLKHPRLYAYLRSKVLSMLSIVIECALLSAGAVNSPAWPVAIAACAGAAMAGYSIWFWKNDPPAIIINYRLSSTSSMFAIYFLIVAAVMPDNPWWYICPTLCGALAVAIAIVRPHDVTFAFRIR